MQTTLKNIFSSATLGLALLAQTAPTWAGAKIPLNAYEVFVNTNYAQGSMIAARYSADTKQYIGCWSAGNPDYANAGCYAVDRAGATVSCWTENPKLVAAVSSITDSSLLTFTTLYGSSECSDIQVDSSSAYLK